MKIVFISNYFSHHQLFLSNKLDELSNHNYTFIETTAMTEERIKLGWRMESLPKYVVYYWDSKEMEKFCEKAIYDADVLIYGSAPFQLLKKRLKAGKLVFRYSERQLKRGMELHKYVYRFIKWHILNKKKYNTYMLCASAYAATDFSRFLLFKGRCFKFGYFPEKREYKDIKTIIEKKTPNTLLWAGRFLDWKHPEIAICVAKRLKKEGKNFRLYMIGTGPMINDIKMLINQEQLNDCVFLLGSLPPDKVRDYMEKTEVFLFTSDRQEGWGAVLNEALNSACVSFVDYRIGSAPYLIKDKENGFLYSDIKELESMVIDYFDNFVDKTAVMKNAYETIANHWNAAVAAERFLDLSQKILNNDDSLFYENGICSRAELLKDGWRKHFVNEKHM